jgi:hypothetical protein
MFERMCYTCMCLHGAESCRLSPTSGVGIVLDMDEDITKQPQHAKVSMLYIFKCMLCCRCLCCTGLACMLLSTSGAIVVLDRVEDITKQPQHAKVKMAQHMLCYKCLCLHRLSMHACAFVLVVWPYLAPAHQPFGRLVGYPPLVV